MPADTSKLSIKEISEGKTALPFIPWQPNCTFAYLPEKPERKVPKFSAFLKLGTKDFA